MAASEHQPQADPPVQDEEAATPQDPLIAQCPLMHTRASVCVPSAFVCARIPELIPEASLYSKASVLILATYVHFRHSGVQCTPASLAPYLLQTPFLAHLGYSGLAVVLPATLKHHERHSYTCLVTPVSTYLLAVSSHFRHHSHMLHKRQCFNPHRVVMLIFHPSNMIGKPRSLGQKKTVTCECMNVRIHAVRYSYISDTFYQWE
ncbi:hypothetical protein E2C01_045019 [Portunus trituberculatus]|uniref:Uncharacterized protein n=1 Tax=Portunus trituberculatus TaxID=210409 RepID=A0A5B7G0Z2_PORTR|nr:hypothetical protein [Portunus trituberculatus]